MNAQDPVDSLRSLAPLLLQRRVALDARFSNRRTFCREKGIDYRVISDLEAARRVNFTAAMVVAIEVAYELAPGTIGAVLRGGGVPQALPGVAPGWERHIRATPDLTPREREAAICLVRVYRGAYTSADVDELLGVLRAALNGAADSGVLRS